MKDKWLVDLQDCEACREQLEKYEAGALSPAEAENIFGDEIEKRIVFIKLGLEYKKYCLFEMNEKEVQVFAEKVKADGISDEEKKLFEKWSGLDFEMIIDRVEHLMVAGQYNYYEIARIVRSREAILKEMLDLNLAKDYSYKFDEMGVFYLIKPDGTARRFGSIN